ncbi:MULTISPECIES: hypothetical protein [unclassified Streptomyces]|uniref:hypothetical protein n=1 Tax=unclassified Streptomyces TaxID=2593676 RepID=UPI0022376601|nr:hypothetical protein [Streptomyces sp. SHP 1-2]MCW5249646.1 hypothetical protein [Streptomyces sp. SHP 1-2]
MPLIAVRADAPIPARAPSSARTRRAAPPAPSTADADVLRIVSDSRTPVFVTEHPDGRRRYRYWRPLDSATGKGGCYVALPTETCELLRAEGRIALGEPIVDPTRTTYRVRSARTPVGPTRTPARTVRTPAEPVRSLPPRVRAA